MSTSDSKVNPPKSILSGNTSQLLFLHRSRNEWLIGSNPYKGNKQKTNNELPAVLCLRSWFQILTIELREGLSSCDHKPLLRRPAPLLIDDQSLHTKVALPKFSFTRMSLSLHLNNILKLFHQHQHQIYVLFGFLIRFRFVS